MAKELKSRVAVVLDPLSEADCRKFAGGCLIIMASDPLLAATLLLLASLRKRSLTEEQREQAEFAINHMAQCGYQIKEIMDAQN